MGMGEALTAPLAIGIGCRAGCAGEAIAALVRRARHELGGERLARLFTVEDKRGESGMTNAAAMLGLDLVFLPQAALSGVAAATLTPSRASAARFGLPSISEAAALAGAGPGAVLLVPRLSAGGATCAIAAPPEACP